LSVISLLHVRLSRVNKILLTYLLTYLIVTVQIRPAPHIFACLVLIIYFWEHVFAPRFSLPCNMESPVAIVTRLINALYGLTSSVYKNGLTLWYVLLQVQQHTTFFETENYKAKGWYFQRACSWQCVNQDANYEQETTMTNLRDG